HDSYSRKEGIRRTREGRSRARVSALARAEGGAPFGGTTAGGPLLRELARRVGAKYLARTRTRRRRARTPPRPARTRWQMIGALIEQVVGNSVNGVLDGILVATAAWGFLRIAGTRNSGLRFAVWFSALLTIVAVFGFRNSSTITPYTGVPEIVVPS